jgi:hypothetical protein
MHAPKTAKPHTMGAGLRKSEQLCRRLGNRTNSSSADNQDPPVILATIPKGGRNAVVLSVRQRGLELLADIRQHEPNGLRELVPTMKGIGNINDDVAEQIIVWLQIFLARCRS